MDELENNTLCGSIYLVTNKINGKQYIGQTIGPVRRRWAQHCSEARCRQGSIIGAAIRKYGVDNFSIVIIAKVNTLDELNELERQCISKHYTLVPNGYNLDQGGKNGGSRHPSTRAKLSVARTGKLGTPHTEEFKLKLAISNIGNKYGSKPKSEEHKRKIAESHKGKSLSAEHKAKISATLTGRSSLRKGIPLTEQTKAKISASLRRYHLARKSHNG